MLAILKAQVGRNKRSALRRARLVAVTAQCTAFIAPYGWLLYSL
jgi:hypothetical protein